MTKPAAAAGLATFVGLLALASVAGAQTVTDPTGSVSVGINGSDANGSLVAYSDTGCARSGLLAVSYDALDFFRSTLPSPRSCGSMSGPVAVGGQNGSNNYGAVVVALQGNANAICWNPLGIGCMPTVLYSHELSSRGGTVSAGNDSCSASDWGPVPGISSCDGSSHTQESSTGSIAIMGTGYAQGRLLAVTNGSSNPNRDSNAYSPNVAASQWGHAYGGKAAVSVHNSAHSGTGGVAIAGITWPFNAWPQPADAYTGPGGVAIAGGKATGGAVAVAGGDATTSPGGVVAVSATGNAGGGVVNIDTK